MTIPGRFVLAMLIPRGPSLDLGSEFPSRRSFFGGELRALATGSDPREGSAPALVMLQTTLTTRGMVGLSKRHCSSQTHSVMGLGWTGRPRFRDQHARDLTESSRWPKLKPGDCLHRSNGRAAVGSSVAKPDVAGVVTCGVGGTEHGSAFGAGYRGLTRPSRFHPNFVTALPSRSRSGDADHPR